MNFQTLLKVESSEFYIDLALRKSREHAVEIRADKSSIKLIDKAKKIETAKINILRESLSHSLEKIIKSFPSIDDLPEFYKELIKVTLDYPKLKKSLGAVAWAKQRINDMYRDYERKIKSSRDVMQMNAHRKEYFGRATSLIKQIKNEFVYLENARRTMKAYPSIKDLPTVAIAGFPNVGKSTLLAKISNATPEIANYAFTTKRLNMGTFQTKSESGKKIQLIDTPGTLNRFEKMNYIERQAELALKYVAKSIIFVIDPTEQYPIEDQKKLLMHVKRFDKPIIVYVSKTDIEDKTVCDELKKRFHAVEFEDLKKEIENSLNE